VSENHQANRNRARFDPTGEEVVSDTLRVQVSSSGRFRSSVTILFGKGESRLWLTYLPVGPEGAGVPDPNVRDLIFRLAAEGWERVPESDALADQIVWPTENGVRLVGGDRTDQ